MPTLDELLADQAEFEKGLQMDIPAEEREIYENALAEINTRIARMMAAHSDRQRAINPPTPLPPRAGKVRPIREPQQPTPPKAQPVLDNRETPPDLVWTFEPDPAPETEPPAEPAPLSVEPPPAVQPAAGNRLPADPTPNRQTRNSPQTDKEQPADRQHQTAPAAEPSTYHISTDEQQTITVYLDGVAYDEQQITDKVRKWYCRWKRADADARRLCPASKVKRLQTAQRNQVKYEAACQALSDHFHFVEGSTTVSIVPRRQYVVEAEQFETNRKQ